MRFAQFAGTELAGTLRISEAAVNELLAMGNSALRGATIEIGPHNRVTLRYGMLHATVILPPRIELAPEPRATFLISSSVVALVLATFLRQPYIRIRGKEATIFLNEVPPLDPYREVWRHVTTAAIRTEPAAIALDVALTVRSDDDA